MDNLYVHYGCGTGAPEDWINFDISPTLRIQKTPILGQILKKQLDADFPSNVRYGDILAGLPGIKDNSCAGAYCSHVLEHLAFNECKLAVANTYKMLKKGGIFRCVVPDLEAYARTYVKALDNKELNAANEFMKISYLGRKSSPITVKARMKSIFGNENHKWMWDFNTLSAVIKEAGFKNVRRAQYGDWQDPMFESVEDEYRLNDAVCIECVK